MDIKLTPEGDLYISPEGNIALTADGSETMIQRLKIRLRTFFQEWILDRSAGTKWHELVLKKGYDKKQADAHIKERIQGTEDLVSIVQWHSEDDPLTRSYTIQCTVKHKNGAKISFGFQDILGTGG